MEGSKANPITILEEESPQKLPVPSPYPILPHKYGEDAQKMLEYYCRLHKKELVIKDRLDRLSMEISSAYFSPERCTRLETRSIKGFKLRHFIFKTKLRIFERAYDEGWYRHLPDNHELSSCSSPSPPPDTFPLHTKSSPPKRKSSPIKTSELRRSQRLESRKRGLKTT